MIVSGAVPPIIVLANSGSFETKTQCMSILQRMLLGRAMPEEVCRPGELGRNLRRYAEHSSTTKRGACVLPSFVFGTGFNAENCFAESARFLGNQTVGCCGLFWQQ